MIDSLFQSQVEPNERTGTIMAFIHNTCRGRHDTIAEARDCERLLAGPDASIDDVHLAPAMADREQASRDFIDRSLAQQPQHWPGRVSAPQGRYAVQLDGALHFFKVDRPGEDSRWHGWTFVSEQAGDVDYPVKAKARKARVLAAISVDPQAAMERYGRELGECGHCGRTLTNEESRARGIGPICAGKMGW